jgi:hypothetical protein
MTGKLQAQQVIAALFLLSVAGMVSGLALKTNSQAQSTKSQITKPGNSHTPPTRPKFYEDDEIKVQIPGGWIISSAKGKISLAKNGYTLGLAYHTTTAEELPDPNDPNLKKIIAEAIDIVDSMQYKRCPPSTTF